MKNPTHILTSLILVAALGACSHDLGKQDTYAGTSARLNAANTEVNNAQATLNGMTATDRPANVSVRSGIYIGHDGFRTGRGDPLPSRFESANGVSMNIAGQTNIVDFALRLRAATGIRVDYRDLTETPLQNMAGDTPSSKASSTADSTSKSKTSSQQQTLRGVFGQPGQTSQNSQGNQGSQSSDKRPHGSQVDYPLDVSFNVNYTGPLSGLLDQVATKIGADWQYRGGVIRFMGPQTMTFTLWALPNAYKTTTSVGGTGSQNAFGSSDPATTETTAAIDFWKSFKASLQAVIPNLGSSYTINPADGTIIVTGYQNVLHRVSKFVAEENARLSRQVSVRVDVIAFTDNQSDSRGVNLNAVLNDVGAGLNLNLVSPTNSVDQSTGITAKLLTKSKGPLKLLGGSAGVINALAKYGKVSVLNSTSVVAANNSPTPVSIVNQQAYLAGSKSTTDSNGNTTTDLTTGIINNGLNLVVTPRIMSGGDVSMSYTMNISQLNSMTRFQSPDGNTTVDLPQVDSRNFMQTLTMPSGSTMVIASYDGQIANRSASSPFNPKFWGLGGTSSFNNSKTKIVVMMTPVVLENQNAPYLNH